MPTNGLTRLPQSLGLRIATAAVVGALAVLGIFTLAPTGVALTAGAVGLAAGWEWARLAGLQPYAARALYLLALAGTGTLLWSIGGIWVWLVLAGASLWWLGFTAWLACGGAGHKATARVALGRTSALALGLLLLPALVLGVASLAHAPEAEAGRGVLMYAVCLVWAADIGAYFAGRAWGRRALAPRISAGKTWEGFAGGLLAVIVYALAGAWLLAIPTAMWLPWTLLALVAGAVSVAGDLFESLLKRSAGVKDSGKLLPGHGGLLDRIDSLIAALPLMALGLAALSLGTVP